MWIEIKKGTIWAAPLALAAGLFAPALAADVESIDWDAVPTNEIKLFYPGQSNYQWLRTPDHRRAFKKVLKGESCISCHEDEEEDVGDVTVSGDRLEPEPIEDKPGSIDLTVQAAYDDENVYFRFTWPTNNEIPGIAHDYIRFNGEEWELYGGSRHRDEVREGDQPAISEDRLTIMIGNDKVPMFKEQGCWLTCHSTLEVMPDTPSWEEVADHPVLGPLASEIYLDAGRHDSHKYLPATRSDENKTWSEFISEDDIAALKADGAFVDFMQWGAARSNPVGMADDGYILEYRQYDEGTIPHQFNIDRETMTPIYMFDPEMVEARALTEDDIGDPDMPYALIREENAVEYDPEAGWEEGDILPGLVISREDAEGSAADNNDVTGVWEDGVWTVVWARPLDTGHPEDDVILEEGNVYGICLAVHDDNVATRFHYLSWPRTFGIGAEAQITAVKIEGLIESVQAE